VIETGVSKVLAIVGLAAIILGVILAILPTTKEVWIHKSKSLVKEVATIYPKMNYWPLALGPYIPEESRNLVVNGTVKELKGHTFDFYVFNKINYERWKVNASYETILQAKNVSSHSFSFMITREDLSEGLRFVILNIYAKEFTQTSWIDRIFTVYEWMDYGYMPYVYPYVDMEQLPILVDGVAKELSGRKFSLLILDDKNLDLWKIGQSYHAFYEGKKVTACSFSFPLTPEQVKGCINLIVERVEPDTEVNVQVSSNISYMKPINISVQYDIAVTWEEKSYSHVLGGLLLGGGLIALGVILMVAATVVKYVFRPDRKESKSPAKFGYIKDPGEGRISQGS
jgi:hypothetical protein